MTTTTTPNTTIRMTRDQAILLARQLMRTAKEAGNLDCIDLATWGSDLVEVKVEGKTEASATVAWVR